MSGGVVGGAVRRGGQIDHQRSTSKLIALKHDGVEIFCSLVLDRAEPVAELGGVVGWIID